jgi:hypothetical protein
MAFHFEFDLTNQILECRFSEVVTEDNLNDFYCLAALFAEALDPLAGLVDFSAVTSFQTNAEFMRKVAGLPPVMPRTERPRVMVAPANHIFGLMRLLGIAGATTRPNFHVVRRVQEAWAMLGVRNPQFRPIIEALEPALKTRADFRYSDVSPTC